MPSDLDELDQHVDDEESRRAIAAASRSAGAHGEDGSGQGGEREGNHQERRFAAVARSRALPSAPEALSLQALVERARAARSFDELVVPLRATIRQSQSGLSEAFVRVAAAWRASPAAIAGPVPVTLAGVKRALLDPMADTSVAPGDGGIDRRAAAHLWLPIYLLNLHRPRSPTQSLQAAERLALIERVLRGRLAGPNRP